MIYDVNKKTTNTRLDALYWKVQVYMDLFSNESLQNTALSIIEKYLTDLWEYLYYASVNIRKNSTSGV